MLLGRDCEQREIADALRRARSGRSATLALVGEPGIGKTALLDYAGECAADMRMLRARGIESEAHIPFASLFELIRPALTMIERIPGPQAVALESALALRPGTAQDRFAVGAATLSLLAAYADERPVAVLIDDAQWVDGSSAQALLFAVRRLVADPIAVFITVRDGEPSLLDGADLPTVRVAGLTSDEAVQLVPALPAETARRLHSATAGNPLALLELAVDAPDLELAPEGAPVLVPAKVARAFARRAGQLDQDAQSALVLAATSDDGDLETLRRAGEQLGIGLSALAAAEGAGLIRLQPERAEFRHQLARSAVYAAAPPDLRRAAHRAIAAALPDRDVDRRAWHLAAAAVGADEAASAALEQAGARGMGRSAYATAAAAFEQAGRLAGNPARRGGLLFDAARASWLAGLTERASTLLEEARAATSDAGRLVDIDQLSGQIAISRGPVMGGHAILVRTARRADPERAVAMLAEAASACMYGGQPAQMLATAEQARAALPDEPSARARFLVASALGMARMLGGDAADGAESVHEAIAIAERSSELHGDLELIKWLATGPLFLREADTGRSLIETALATARDVAAVSALPLALNLLARDQANTDRWAVAESTYREAIELARESGHQTELAFGLSGLAWLQARRGRESDCRACAAEALGLCRELGARLHEVWVLAALGELELGLGHAERAAAQFEAQQQARLESGITDADLSPAPELVDAYLRLGRTDDAQRASAAFSAEAIAKGQAWSLARAERCQGMLAPETEFAALFDRAIRLHDQTPDAFEAARTRLAYGERLRRARNRILAREQLRAAAEAFEQLGASPWAERARGELAATGERRRRSEPGGTEELTPQELQIALLLTSGKTTKQTAAALFLSPKTVEYHLRHIYGKLGINSREQLSKALAGKPELCGGWPPKARPKGARIGERSAESRLKPHKELSMSTWQVDPYHTQVEFSAKHLGMMTVRGYFAEVAATGDIHPERPEASSVQATISTASIRTHNDARDNDLRSSNFLGVEKYPVMTFASTSIEPDGEDQYKLTGDLTIKGITHPVTLDLRKYGEFNDPMMGHRIAYGATTKINRREFGLTMNVMLDGRFVVSDEILISIEGELVEQQETAEATA
ncbi:MAG TPA: YceI family protein [Streptosporangiaceae bacterium]